MTIKLLNKSEIKELTIPETKEVMQENYIYSLMLKNRNELFSEDTLLSLYKQQVKNKDSYVECFEDSISHVNQIFIGNGFYIEFYYDKDNTTLYSLKSIENPKPKAKDINDALAGKNKVISDLPKSESFNLRVHATNANLLASREDLDFIFNTTGLTRQTICKIKLGYDDFGYTFPIFKYSTDYYFNDLPSILDIGYISFNFEEDEFFHIIKKNHLGMVNSYTPNTSILVLVDNILDGYTLWQYLNESNLSMFYHIVLTSENSSTSNIIENVKEVEFGRYNTFYLLLSNNDKSDIISMDIKDKYPMFERITYNFEYNNFNEFYRREIKPPFKETYPV